MKRLRQFLPWLVAAVFVAAGASRVSYDVNITALLPPDMKETKGLALFLDHFAHRDELICVVEADAPAGTSAAADKAAAALRTRTDLAAQVVARPPMEEDPDAAAGFLAWTLLNLPPDQWRTIEADLAPDKVAARLAAVQEAMATGFGGADGLMGYDPLGLAGPLIESLGDAAGGSAGTFASADGRQRILFIRSPRAYTNWHESGAWVDAVRAALSDALAGSGATFGLTGHPAYETEAARVMQQDMTGSGLGSLVLTAGIFWLCYRSFRPLLLVTVALAMVALLTMAAGGLLLPGMNVMTAGFAGILIGLVVDYGILVHQETLDAERPTDVRKRARGGIIAAAATTAAAFLSLTVCTVPGISGLGLLVGLGIVIGAAFMLGPFCSWLLHGWRPRTSAADGRALAWFAGRGAGRLLAVAAAAVVAASLAGLAVRGLPRMDTSMECMRLQNSEAERTMKRATAVLGGTDGMQWLVRTTDAAAMRARLESMDAALRRARETGAVARASLPLALWPHGPWRTENLSGPVARIAARADALRTAVLEAGYEPIAWELTARLCRLWTSWQAAGGPPDLPPSDAARWMLDRFVHRNAAGEAVCMASIVPAGPHRAAADALRPEADAPDMFLMSESLLSGTLADRIPRELFRILAVLGVCVLGLLALIFRRAGGVVLCCGVMALNLLCLLGAMAWFGLSWNFFNLTALLLALGTGIDYSIHVLLALRRGLSPGDLRRTTGRALMSCCLTTTAGFASLVSARLDGLVSMGLVCAMALAVNLIIALFLLPPVAARFMAPPARP